VIFEWNEQKRRDNLRKHGLDFADCDEVFQGPMITMLDDRFAYDEARLLAFGLLRERIVVIAYAEAEGVIRVISMRKADRREKTWYFENL